jgi:cell wall-associated NlpC family hydrolase
MFTCVVLLTSCGGAKGTVKTKRDKDDLRTSYPDYQTGKPSGQGTVDYTEVGELRKQVIDNALTYLGIPYRFGGTTINGMDCSGLIYTAHREAGINIPRTSASMYGDARKVEIDEVVPGDLLFFGTSKNSRRVNHVGLITEVTDDDTFFIHSTTSAGVIVSSLNEEYWRDAFVKAGKIK